MNQANGIQPQTPGKSSNDQIDTIAYVAPMLTFMAIIFAATYLPKNAYPWMYVARAAIVAGLLIYFRRWYTPIRWNAWYLGILVGVVGIFQWVGMQMWLEQFAFFKPKPDDAFNPFNHFQSPAVLWGWIIVRTLSASLIVPFMEELFWRDFLWRQLIAPNDFKLAKVGEFDWVPFLGVAAAFALVHGNWWLTSIVWALMIHCLLIYTKSLGACIIAHGVTNLLLALYVLKYHAWSLW